MAESVVVGVRVRPFNEREKALSAELCIDMDGPTTTIRNLKCGEGGSATHFTFDESFWSHDGFDDDGNGYYKAQPGSKYADQAYVFNTFGARVLNNAWEGFHCCLFAYGQTGSGKSYSMVGYGPNKGIVPISCEEIFRRIGENTNADKHYEVVVSVVEIYNELVQDLLVNPEERPKKGLDIRESKLLGIYIDGVHKRPVDSYPAIEKTIDEATENRTVGSTLMNATSSRAHTVLTIEFKQVEKVPGASQSTTKVSMINLVDLAGSEKAGQTGATGDRLKEGAAINKSLSALGNVIEKLAQRSSGKKNVIIPYRESKLTRLLQNALGGSSKTIMICALSPASSNYEETLSTLRYADRAKRIKNTAVVNENPQEKLMRELREENNKLKEFMESMKDTLGEQDAAALNEKVKEIKAAEEVLKEQNKSWKERLMESQENERKRESRKTLGRNNVLSVAPDLPHIANLNEDQLLTGRIKHKFPEGVTTRIGQVGGEDAKQDDDDDDDRSSDDDSTRVTSKEDSDTEKAEAEVQIVGENILAVHATVTNTDGHCILRSKGKAADSTYVNGVSIAVLLKQKEVDKPAKRGSLFGDPTEEETEGVALNHGDRVAFAKCLFVFVEPAKGMADILIMSGQVSYFAARKELTKNQWRSAGLKFMKGMKMTKALGAKELSSTLLRRMSTHGGTPQESMHESVAPKHTRASMASSIDMDSSGEVLDADTALEMLRTKERELEAKDQELHLLRQQLRDKDAALVEARAAARAGASSLQGSRVTDEWPEVSPSSTRVEFAGLGGRKAADIRAQIVSTFESAISAIEQVEAVFSTRHPAKQLAAG